MSLYLDKKKEHEDAAQKALKSKNYSKAFWHTAKAAEYGLNLAEKSDGKLARAYLDDANGLMDLAEEMKTKSSRIINTKENVDRDDSDDDTELSKHQVKIESDIKLDDVIGLNDVKELINELIIQPIKSPERYERYSKETGGSVILYGPPGNGKTYIAKAIAGELNLPFFSVDMSRIKNKYYGETEKNIRELFSEISSKEAAVVFMDEIDSILENRGNRKVNMVNQFLTELDGVEKRINGAVMFLGATNRPWAIDEAIMRSGRFNDKIYVGLPDEDARTGILQLNMREVPQDSNINWENLSKKTRGYSGADLALICSKAKQSAINRECKNEKDDQVTQNDIEDAIKKVIPTVSKDTVEKLKSWGK